MTTKIAIHGAAGRMGKRLVALGSADDELQIVAALDSASHPEFGKDAGIAAGVDEIKVALSDQFPDEVDSVIDFSIPAASEIVMAKCVEQKVPLVIATTGFDSVQKQKIQDSAKLIPIVYAPNMSMAVNLTMKLAEMTGTALANNPTGTDVEIIDRHHRYKEDAPSGTALRFGEIVASVMGQTKHIHGREGITGQRGRDEIGYHALRVGDNPGEHTIVFALLGETIELTVRATSRDCYALGALAAAKFVAKQSPGMYNMYDVLGL